jgi:endo-1,3-1,4-beta-glycanase ExoK
MHPRAVSVLLFSSSIAACAAAVAQDNTAFIDSFQDLNRGRWYISNGWANGDYQSCEWRADAVTSIKDKMRLTLSDRGGKVRPFGCGEIRTRMLLGYGLFEARIRSAAGSGLNTGFFTYVGPPTGSAEHDEIDFEFLGKDPHTVNINHFTNGKPYDGKVVQLGYDASRAFHNYAIEWEPNKIRWYVDRTLVAETPVDAKIPRNPGNLYFSLWSGSNVEDDWMGPFRYTTPVTAEVQWTSYTPSNVSCQFPDSLKCK